VPTPGSTSHVKSLVSHIPASYDLELAIARTERPSKCVHMHRSDNAASERSRLYFNDLPRNGRTIVRFMNHKKGHAHLRPRLSLVSGDLRGPNASRCQSPPHGSRSKDFATPRYNLHIAMVDPSTWKERLSVGKADVFCMTGCSFRTRLFFGRRIFYLYRRSPLNYTVGTAAYIHLKLGGILSQSRIPNHRLHVHRIGPFRESYGGGIFLAATRMASRDGLRQYDLQDPAVTKDLVRLSVCFKSADFYEQRLGRDARAPR
jgi:hypothetical protein